MTLPPSGDVTFLFSDIEGSTRLLGRHPAAYAAALLRHDRIMRDAIAAHGGVVFETIGDAVYAAFDQPADAIQASARAQIDLHREDWGPLGELRVRMAVHGGEVERRGDHYFGPALYRAARLMSIGHGGQVLLSRSAADAARHELAAPLSFRAMGTHRLKDIAEPVEVFQLAHPDLPADFAPLRALDPHATNLPTQPTTFVGREREREDVRTRLDEARLLTLTGPGGTGKTRLALQVATDVMADFDDGVWFVGLAAIRDPALVGPAIAEALHVVERRGSSLGETLARHLAGRELLLVVDNFEQVTAAATLVADLVAAAPRSRFLVTSRVPLHVAAEQRYAVPALPTSATDATRQADAVVLFIQRALAVRPDLPLDAANLEAIAGVASRLEGLPLAIELAAARSSVLAPPALLSRLRSRLPVLAAGAADAPDRQRSMRAAIAWSYDLLGATEREVFERLGVFSGGCRLEAAESVCGAAADDVFGVLATLVDSSLVSQEPEPDGEPRFLMLETIREYALERLSERDGAVPARAAHAAHFLAFSTTAEHELRGPTMTEWNRRVRSDEANIVGALEWYMAQGGREEALRICGNIGWFWLTRGPLDESRRRAERAVALAGRAPPEIEAHVLLILGQTAMMQGNIRQSWIWHERSLELFRAAGREREVAMLIHDLGNVALFAGDDTRARALCDESLEMRRRIGAPPHAIAHGLGSLGEIARYQGDLERARALFEEGMALRPVADLRLGYLENLGMLALEEGDPERARPLLTEALTGWHDLASAIETATCLAGFAAIALSAGDPVKAARLLGAAESQLEPAGAVLWPADQRAHARILASARAALDPSSFEAARSEGRAMPTEVAVELALAAPRATLQPMR